MKHYKAYPKPSGFSDFKPLYTGNLLTGTLANNEDQDEMQHNAAFHLRLLCLLRLKQPSETEIYNNLETSKRLSNVI